MLHLSALISTWRNFNIEYRTHATRRMFERDITNEDIEKLLVGGEVIEQYPDDYPLPSLLLSGQTLIGKPLHVVIGINERDQVLVVVTTYRPDAHKWTDNFSQRKL